MKRKLLILLISLAIIAIAAFIYINSVFLPIQVKQIVIDQAQKHLGRQVDLAEIKYNPVKGIVVSDFSIYEDAEKQKRFLNINELNVRLLLPAVIKKKQFIIPFIVVKTPTINIIRQNETTWNFSDIIVNLQSKPSSDEQKPKLLIGKIVLENATIHYTDERGEQPFQETLDNTNVKINLSVKGTVQAKIETTLAQQSATIHADAQYHLASKKSTANLDLTNIDLAETLPHIYQHQNIQIKNGILQAAGLNILYQNKTLDARGTLKLKDSHIIINSDKIIRGNINLNDVVLKLKSEMVDFTSPHISVAPGQLNIGTDKKLTGDLTAKDTHLTRTKDELNLQTAFQINGAHLNIPGKQLVGDISATESTLSWDYTKLAVDTHLDIRQADLTLAGGQKFEGNPSIDLHIDHNPKAQNPFLYSGTLLLDGASLSGLPRIESAANCKGKISFETNKLNSEQLELTALNTDIELSGELSNFANPLVNIQFSSKEVDAQNIKHLFADFLKAKQVDIAAIGAVQGTYKGKIREPLKADIDINANISEGILETERLKGKITEISGQVNYTPRLITWDNLYGLYRDRQYVLKGEFRPVRIRTQPLLKTALESDNLELTIQLNFDKNTLYFNQFKGTYHNSLFNVSGTIDLAEEGQPNFNLKGNVDFNLIDLPILFPAQEPQFQALKPQGTLTIHTSLNGTGTKDNWPNWQIAAAGKSPTLSLSGYSLNSVTFQYEQSDQKIQQLNLTSSAYGGQISLNSSASLADEEFPFQLALSWNNANLAKLKEDTPAKDKHINGTLQTNLTLNGALKQMRSVQGRGYLTIADGHLWEFNLFKGLWQTLLIPEYEDIVFTAASANFVIQDEKIDTQDLIMTSNALELYGSGWIDFDKNINFKIEPKFKEIAIIQSDSIKKGPTSILTQTENYLTIKLEGTLNKPNYSVSTQPTKVIENATDALIDGLQDIFQDVF